MKKYIAILCSLLILSCDDGDFNVPALDFSSQEIQFCDTFVFYKINDSESLIINLNSSLTAQEFLLTQRDATNNTFEIGSNGNTINYRVFNSTVSSSYFCQSVPPASPTVTKEWDGTAQLVLENTITNDDEDGVVETDLNLDTDNDGTPNYLDNDDDGDGVLTKDELDIDENPLDTDGDGIFDYLDTDDDNDGVLTIDEALTDSNNDSLSLPDYLDPSTTDQLPNSRNAIEDSYTSSYLLTFTLNNLVLTDENSDTLTFTIFDYGTLQGSYTITE